jgi:hypothetical protein
MSPREFIAARVRGLTRTYRLDHQQQPALLKSLANHISQMPDPRSRQAWSFYVGRVAWSHRGHTVHRA